MFKSWLPLQRIIGRRISCCGDSRAAGNYHRSNISSQQTKVLGKYCSAKYHQHRLVIAPPRLFFSRQGCKIAPETTSFAGFSDHCMSCCGK
ncbi:hypothetical protein P692DRAFT_20194189 [Suillus brevipes Sb2]|nr:hypothetical protein P692DRAFT_20194189 [Suillus brevipes Sb2]